MSTYYQNVPVSYPVNYTMNENYSYTQHAVNAGITGAIVGAVAGTAKGVYQTEKASEERVIKVAKIAARDSAICGASSFAGALASSVTGTKGLLSLAIFAAAGVGTGYMLNKVMLKSECAVSEEVADDAEEK